MFGLSALPASSDILKTGSIVTFIIRVNTTFMPSESTILSTLRKDIDAFSIAETMNVSRGLFSNDYNVVFRLKKNMVYSIMANIVRNSFNISMKLEVSIIDVKAEFYEAPSPVSLIISPITKIAEATPGVLSSVKWIALAGLGIYGLFLASPVLKKLTK